MIEIYLYYYDSYEYIISNLKILNFEEEYGSSNYEKYRNRKDQVKAIVYRDAKILAIQQEDNKEPMKIKGLSLLKKVNLLDRKIFIDLFETSFSKNLCNIKFDIDISGDEEDIVEFMGHRLLEQNLLEQFDFYDDTTDIKIKAYELQPKGYKYLIKISLINKLEFNSNYKDEDIENMILKLIVLVNLREEENARS